MTSGEPPRDAHSAQRAKNAWNIGVSGVLDEVGVVVAAYVYAYSDTPPHA